MEKTDSGLVFSPEAIEEAIEKLHALYADEAPYVKADYSGPDIDSSSFVPQHWLDISAIIRNNAHEYDAFIVLTGTDTLAYTSSALSFLLFDLVGKPIVVTGSQVPISAPRSDGLLNLLASLDVAVERVRQCSKRDASYGDVIVCFGSKIMRGNQVTKVSSNAFDAFDSPRHALLGTIGAKIKETGKKRGTHIPRSVPTIPSLERTAVALLRLYPGFDCAIIRNLPPTIRGIVLEGFGSGNGPDDTYEFLTALRELRRAQIPVVMSAQPLIGSTDSDYESGIDLVEAGVVSVFETTTEAAFAKLTVLLSCEPQLEYELIQDLMKVSIAGEMEYRSPSRLVRNHPATMKN